MQKILAAASISVALIAPAVAADLRPLATKAPAVVAPTANYSWSGFYLGLHAGWLWSDAEERVGFLPTPGAFQTTNFALNGDRDGFLGGGQVGFNWQAGPIVLGLEADISGADVSGSGNRAPILTPTSFYASSWDMNWFATVRGRLGVTVSPSAFIYVTGGFAAADIDYATRTLIGAPGGPADWVGAASETETGWTLGGGLEWGFAPSWSLKAEYLYFDLGDTTVTALPVVPNPPFAVATTFENNGHIFRGGINYRFGGAPVAARY